MIAQETSRDGSQVLNSVVEWTDEMSALKSAGFQEIERERFYSQYIKVTFQLRNVFRTYVLDKRSFKNQGPDSRARSKRWDFR